MSPRPQTTFLEDAAQLARESILARLDPALAYQPFFRLDLGSEVPEALHASWDYCDMAGRFVDALILTAPMVNAETTLAEEGLRAFLLSRANPNDGLFYDAEAPWSRYAADMFCQGRVFLGLVSWFLLTGDATVQANIDGLIAGLSRIAVWDGDRCSYPHDLWIDDHWEEGGLWNGGQPGYSAQQLIGIARYAKATGNPAARRLARGLATHFVHHTDVVAADGSFHGHTHSQGILPSALGVLTYALVAGDDDLAAWARRLYEYARQHTSPFGWIPDGLAVDPASTPYAGTCETCSLADLIELAINLTEAGLGDYWDDVERFARNQLLEQQIRDVTQAVPAATLDQSTTPVRQILRGAFDSAARPNSLIGDPHGTVEGCCTPAGARACFLVWDRVMTRRPDGVHINLTATRDAPWARLTSYEPYRGELHLEVREADTYHLRLPEWADANYVHITRNGQNLPITSNGRIVVIGPARSGDTYVVTYPQSTSTETSTIVGQDYETTWKGGTVTSISPAGSRYPIYQRDHFLSSDPPMTSNQIASGSIHITW